LTEASFGAWLKHQRGAKGWTQKQLAQQINCSLSLLRKMEAEERRPSTQILERLSELFNIPKSELKSFLSFARGGWEAFSGDDTEYLSWQVSDVVPRTNLPSAISSFIGREKEQAEVNDLLAKNRLVTLVGTGGIGKTSLSLHVGQKLLNEYPNGVWFISLDSLSDPRLVPQTVASVFDIREGSSDQPLIERLTYSLHAKTVLLILDNCEHLLDICAQLITTLLQNCPHLKILATSREVLNVAGEAIYQMQSLSTPEQDNISLEKLSEYESVRLFTERAALALPSFTLTKENFQAVIDICRKVDGIPLALELAAVRVNILNVAEISNQLQSSFALLSTDHRAPLSRHQTLQASMDWSWGLLNDAEQTFMQQLVVFAGGWTLEAAQAVCDGDVLSLTDALVRKSLIVVHQVAGRMTRYRFHEIVRQYAHEKYIESGEDGMARTRHLVYILRLSEKAEKYLNTTNDIQWYSRMFSERDNIRAALEWADKADVEAGLYISSRLHYFLELFNLREGNAWLAKFLGKPESRGHPRARAKALDLHGWFLASLQQFDASHSAAQECLELYRSLGDKHGEVDGLLRLSYSSADIAERLKLNQEALRLAESLGDARRLAKAFWQLGWLTQGKERFVHWDKALEIARPLEGNLSERANSFSTMGFFLVLHGDLDRARMYLSESIAIYQHLNMKSATAHLLLAYGQIALIQSDFETARQYFQGNLQLGIKFGSRQDQLWSQVRLGYVALRENIFHDAYNYFTESIREFQKDKYTIGVVFALEGMAELNVTSDKPAIAAQLIGWADATRETISDTRPPLEQADMDKIIAACIAKIGEEAFSDAYETGKKMTLDEAVALALDTKQE